MRHRIAGIAIVAALLVAARAGAQTSGPLPSSPLFGGVPNGERTDQVVALTLGDAIQRGLDHNLAALLGEQQVQQANGVRWKALSGVLPNLSGNLSAAREKINLAAFGFTGPGIPTLVGPFDVYDARMRLSQSLLDLSAINEAKAGAHLLDAQKASYADTRSLVVAAVTNLYLVSVADQSRVEAAEAAERTADTTYKLAADQNAAGVVPKLDELRADVELRGARQRTIVSRNDLAKSKLALARAIGMPLGQAISLADSVPFSPAPSIDVDALAKTAYEKRDDAKAAEARVAAAEATARAASFERLPSVTFDADYGAIGNTTQSMLGTFTVAANVHVPIFNAGKTKARTLETSAELTSRRAEAADLRARIYYDVQTASLDLTAASDQVTVARDAVSVAGQALEQSQDRFKSGVANNLEVVQAQQALTSSRENYIAALYSHNVAKVALARALGAGEHEFIQLLEGTLPWPTSH